MSDDNVPIDVMDTKDEEENDSFPQATSASVVPIHRTRSTAVTNEPSIFKKLSPPKKKDSSPQATFASAATICRKRSMTINLSLQKEKDKDSSTDYDGLSAKCKHILNHQHLDDVNLRDEGDNRCLNEGQLIRNLSCSHYKKKLVKNYKGVADESSVVAFNKKRTV